MYKPPVCECGKPLCFWEEVMHTTYTPITKNGKLSKRNKFTFTENGAWNRLHCENCGKEYYCNKDDKNRFIRGKVWSE